MFSRETCSVVPNCWLAGLLVFLAAFVTGVLTSQASVFLDRYYFSAPNQNAVEELKEFNACNNEDGISLMKWYDVPGEDRAVKPRLGISNSGPGSIYFDGADLRIYTGQDQTGLPLLPLDVAEPNRESVLKPSHTIIFPIKPDVAKSTFTIKFLYKAGEQKAWHFVKARFRDDVQFPDGCSCCAWLEGALP